MCLSSSFGEFKSAPAVLDAQNAFPYRIEPIFQNTS